jgi:hypothetical protein
MLEVEWTEFRNATNKTHHDAECKADGSEIGELSAE